MESGDLPPSSGDIFHGGTPVGEAEAAYENSDIARLRQIWRNEKFAPELLPMDRVLVENITEQLEYQEDVMKNAREEDPDESQQPVDPERTAFEHKIYTKEIDTIRYMLRDYLRTRLFKLNEHPQHYLDPSNMLLLSEAERIYVKGMWEAQEGFFKNRMLLALPSSKRRLDMKEDLLDLVRRPDLDRNVYIKVLQDIGFVISVSLTPGSTQESEVTPSGTRQQDLQLMPGHTYTLKYRHVRQLLMNPEQRGKICLV